MKKRVSIIVFVQHDEGNGRRAIGAVKHKAVGCGDPHFECLTTNAQQCLLYNSFAKAIMPSFTKDLLTWSLITHNTKLQHLRDDLRPRLRARPSIEVKGFYGRRSDIAQTCVNFNLDGCTKYVSRIYTCV